MSIFACFVIGFGENYQVTLSLSSVPWGCDELHRNIFGGEIEDNMMSVVV